MPEIRAAAGPRPSVRVSRQSWQFATKMSYASQISRETALRLSPYYSSVRDASNSQLETRFRTISLRTCDARPRSPGHARLYWRRTRGHGARVGVETPRTVECPASIMNDPEAEILTIPTPRGTAWAGIHRDRAQSTPSEHAAPAGPSFNVMLEQIPPP